MKRHSIVILSLALAMVLTSCGSTETTEKPGETTEQVENTENENTEETTDATPYNVEELGEFSYNLDINFGEIISIRDNNQLKGYMDAEGNILCEPKYQWLTYSDGMLTLEEPSDSGVGKKYYQSLDGDVTIDKVNGQDIAMTNDFTDGYASVCLYNSDGEVEENYKIIDKQGNVVLETEIPNTFYRRDEDGNFILRDSDEIFAVYKSDLTLMTEEELSQNENLDGDEIFYVNGVYVVEEYGYNPVAIYDKEKEQAITDYSILVEPIKVGDNYLVAKQGVNEETAYWCIINDKYEEVSKLDLEFDYTNTPIVVNDKIVLYYEDGRSPKVLDENGNVFKETKYDSIYSIGTENDIYFTIDGKTGMLDQDFNEVIPAEYDWMTEIVDGVGFAQKGEVLYKVTANN